MDKKIIENIYSETLMSLSDDTLKKLLGEDGYNYLIEYDDYFIKISKELEKEWKQKYIDIRKKEWELIDENKEFTKEARLRYLKELREEIDKTMTDVMNLMEKMIDEDVPYWFRSIIFDHWKKLVIKYNRIKNEIFVLENNKNSEITIEMIERARQYPIGRFLEINRQGFAKCPFHPDTKPSLYTKNNFYYCFGCGASGDVIDLCMKLYGLNFVEAVKKLQ